MKKSIYYTEAPKAISKALLTGNKMNDFLPPPEMLIRKKKINLSENDEDRVNITISLNTHSIDFFKEHAEKNNIKYQTMINEVLENYVQKYKDKYSKL